VVFAASWAKHGWNDVSEAFKQMEGPVETSVAARSDQGDQHKEDNLAVKMMFNYEAESNARAIFGAMNRELVPLRQARGLTETMGLSEDLKILPPHSNIVDMPVAFTDWIPEVKEALIRFPDALPRR